MILLATNSGVIALDPATGEERAAGLSEKEVNHLYLSPEKKIFAVCEQNEIWTGPEMDDLSENGWHSAAVSPQSRIHCLVGQSGSLILGTTEAHIELLPLKDGAQIAMSDGFESLPGREDWSTPWGGPPDVRSLARTRTRLYADIHVGWICVSEDSGRTWTLLRDGLEADVHQVITHPDRNEWVAAATADGFFRSSDCGQTWEQSRKRFGSRGYMRAVAVDLDDSDLMVISGSLGPHGMAEGTLFRSIDGGAGWEKCHRGLPEHFSNNIDTHKLAASPSVGGQFAFTDGEGDIFFSSDGATSWSQIATLNDTNISTLILT